MLSYWDILLNITPVSASVCNEHINWEREPNNLETKEETNYLIPYSDCGRLNKGYLPTGDIDVWNFYAVKKNYKVSFRPPEGYYYDLVIWERVNGQLEKVAVTDGIDQVKEIDLPGVHDNGVIREYLVVVHNKWNTSRDADEPYTLVLDDR